MESTTGQETRRPWTIAYEIWCTVSLKTESEVKTLIGSFVTWCLQVTDITFTADIAECSLIQTNLPMIVTIYFILSYKNDQQ